MLAYMINDVEGLVMRVEAWENIQRLVSVHPIVKRRLTAALEQLAPELSATLKIHSADSVEVFLALEMVDSRVIIQCLAGDYQQSFI